MLSCKLDRTLYRIIVDTLGQKFLHAYLDNFSKRIIVQKTLYLLTHGKKNPKIPEVALPYRWKFYLHGPYSDEIAHALFYMKDFSSILGNEPDEKFTNFKNQSILEQEQQEIDTAINHFKVFSKKISDSSYQQGLSHEEFYEMLATIVYIADQLEENVNNHNNRYKAKIEHKYCLFKPELWKKTKNTQFEAILNTMNSFGYI